jgi:hypothetical protein
VAVLACLARIVYLDADPYVATWTQYVVDEGRWNEAARSMALYGNYDVTLIGRLHLLLSPGYQFVNYLIFASFGVDFWTARIFAAASGIAIVLGVIVALWRIAMPSALALGVVVLGFEANMLAESRLALPEIPSLLGILLAFLVLVLARRAPGNALIAGILALLAVAIKGTSLLVVPVLPLIILLDREGGPLRGRVRNMVAFLAGFGIPMLAGIAAAAALGLVDFQAQAATANRILDFLSVSDPRYMVWRYFDSTPLEARNLMLLGAWLCSWIWVHRDPDANPIARNVYLMSGLWAAWWLVAWSINDYTPGRYVVHFVLPATIHVVTGLSLAGNRTYARIDACLAGNGNMRRLLLAVWLVLPSAVMVAPMFAGIDDLLGNEGSSVTARIAIIVILAGALTLLALRAGHKRGVVSAFLILPVVGVLLWLGLREFGVTRQFWSFQSVRGLAIWVCTFGTAAVVCFSLAIRWWRAGTLPPMLPGFSAALAAILLVQSLPPFLNPTYSIRDASVEVGRMFTNAKDVRTLSASSMFLANKLRYRELNRAANRFDVLIVFEHNLSSRRYLQSPRAANLVRVHTFPIVFHPRYVFDESKFGSADVTILVPG